MPEPSEPAATDPVQGTQDGPAPHSPMAGLDTPTVLRLAAAIFALDGLALAVAGVIWAVSTIVGKPDNVTASIVGAVFAIAFGALMVRLAGAVAVGNVWARSPVVAIAILMLPVGFALTFQDGQKLYGIPVLSCAIAVLLLLFSRPAREVFDRER